MQQEPVAIRRDETVLPNDPPWDTLSEHSVEQLLNAMNLIALRRGDQVDCNVGIVCSGALAVERNFFDGRRALCALYHGGDVVDLRCTERARQGHLIALKPSQFLCIENKWLETYTGWHVEIADAMLARLRHQFARTCDHVTDLVHKTPVERLAALLFEFRRWPENEPVNGDDTVVRIPIQRCDIADYIGVKPETFSRATTKLAREGLIKVSRRDEILIVNVPAMRRIANGGRPRQSTRAV